jgi:hypothetical protein
MRISDKDLDSLLDFGKESDGSYCDRDRFSICHVGNETCFYLFNEVDGSEWFVKELKDFEDLKQLYKAITNKELELDVDSK